MEKRYGVIGENVRVKIKKIDYQTFENGTIGAIIYFCNKIILVGFVNQERKELLLDSVVMRTWDKPNLDKLGVGGELIVYVTATTNSVIAYDFNIVPDSTPVKVLKKPRFCPLCNHSVVITGKDENKYKCENINCNRYEILRITRFIRFCLCMPRFSYTTAYFLYIDKEITCILDIYNQNKNGKVKTFGRRYNTTLQEVLNIARFRRQIKMTVLFYALLPNTTPNNIWRYANSEFVVWYRLPSRPYTFEGASVRKDRLDTLENCMTSFALYKMTHQEEVAELVKRLEVNNDINPVIYKKTFYLLPSPHGNKDYLNERIRLYSGSVDRERHDVNDHNEMRNIDVVVGTDLNEMRKTIYNHKLEFMTYDTLLQELGLR